VPKRPSTDSEAAVANFRNIVFEQRGVLDRNLKRLIEAIAAEIKVQNLTE
jgi:hypothetical protein